MRPVLADPADFMELRPLPRNSVISWAVALSALLHGVLLVYLDPFAIWRPDALEAEPVFPPIEVQLRALIPEPVDSEAKLSTEVPPPPEPPTAYSPSPVTPVPAPAPSTVPAPAATLRLDVPGPGSVSEQDAPASGLTDNGAVVMQPELLSALRNAERRSGYTPGSEGGAGTEFEAGHWLEYIRDGNRCFKVVRADPLQTGSHDMWYRIKCR